jgi:tetratricopeptide (TPR) repeat protein
MSVSQETSPAPASKPVPPSRLLSTIGLVFAAVLLAVIAGAAWAGYRAGLSTRDDHLRATQASDLKSQFDLGVSDLAAGRPSMAVARFEYILSLDPDYPGAREKLAEAQAALDVTPTPLPPTPPPIAGEDPAQILALAQTYAAATNWDGVIDQITRLHAADPDYETVKADGLLFTALRGRGLARIQGDAMEAGIFDLDQAGAFAPLDTEARNYRAWARLYLAAKSFWGLDWAKAVDILSQLYVLAPNFKDTSRLLYQATLNYAAQLNVAGDVCAAAGSYAAAQQLFPDSQVAELQVTAEAACALTPTPEPTVSGPEGAVTDTPTPSP